MLDFVLTNVDRFPNSVRPETCAKVAAIPPEYSQFPSASRILLDPCGTKAETLKTHARPVTTLNPKPQT